jgi:PmbA protein
VLERSPAQKRDVLERALREISHQAAPSLGISLRDGVSRVALVNSRGLKTCFHRTLALLSLTFTPSTGPTLVAEHVGCGIESEEIAGKAEEILRLRDPREEMMIAPRAILLKSSAAPVLMRWLERALLSPEPAGAAGRMASEAVDLVDDPLLSEGIASTPFDGEGFPSTRKTLLKAGIEVGRLQEDPTSGAGSGRRAVRPSYRDVPAPGGTNLFALPGRRVCAEMLGSVETGVVLAALDHEARESDLATEIQWRGIGWEARDGRVSGGCGRYLFRAAPRTLLNSVVESSSGLRFSLHRSTALGCGDLLILPRT